MSSETPEDGLQPSKEDTSHKPRSGSGEKPGSLGLEMLEPSHHDGSTNLAHSLNSDGDDVNFLMPHERKLPLATQRLLLAGRRHTDGDEVEEEVEVRSGRRHMLWKLHNEERGLGAMPNGKTHVPGATTTEPASAPPPGELTPTVAAEIEKVTAPTIAAATEARAAAPGETALLNDAANPNKPLFDTVLKGVGELDPSRVALTPAEQTNVAAALAANITQTPGFQRDSGDPALLSVVASDNGDRVFAINNLNPDAPNAVHTSVAVEQARTQPLNVSTAQAVAQQQELPPPKPVQEQAAPTETVLPRAIV